MQPLSYQMFSNSCWVTSMLNGLLLLNGDKEQIPWLAYQLLHARLTEDGVHSQGKTRRGFDAVLGAVQGCCTDLEIRNYQGKKVEMALRKMNFKNQVAVCDIDAGGHSILLTGKSSKWIEVFDPDWDQVNTKKLKRSNAYAIQPNLAQVGRFNVLVGGEVPAWFWQWEIRDGDRS